MDASEMADRASALPDRFAGRLPTATAELIARMDDGGEYGELVAELTATLAKTGATVSSAERLELLELLKATGMPLELADRLTVRD